MLAVVCQLGYDVSYRQVFQVFSILYNSTEKKDMEKTIFQDMKWAIEKAIYQIVIQTIGQVIEELLIDAKIETSSSGYLLTQY